VLVGAGAELDKLQAIFSGYVRDRMMCAAGKGSGGRALAACADSDPATDGRRHELNEPQNVHCKVVSFIGV
jgi:hypothetical protein